MAVIRSIILIGLNDSNQDIVSRVFMAAKRRLVFAAGVPEAIRFLRASPADLGYLQPSVEEETFHEIQQIKEAFPLIPIVLLCSGKNAVVTLDALRSITADVITLPLTESSLMISLKRVEKLKKESMDGHGVLARFQFLDESGQESWATIHSPCFTIGRSSTNNLPLSGQNISRSHAEVFIENGEYLLRDVGSRHGTYLNGSRIEQPILLKNGDRIQLGNPQGFTLTFHHGDLLQSLLSLSDSKFNIRVPANGFREIGMLLATFRALSSIPLLDDLLALVVDTAIELTGAERGFIMLKNESGDLLFRCARNSYKSPLDGTIFQTSRLVPEQVFRTGKSSVINDLDCGDSSSDHAHTRRLGVRSIICVPLHYFSLHESGSESAMGHVEIIGVLYVDSQIAAAGLSDTQLDAMETLASEAAMAIYNARLYKDSQEKRKLEQELVLAKEIQQALLPNPVKILPFVTACSHSIPCREIGGDYFDYFDLPAGKLGFAVGDVAGKGMSAALLASMLQGIFSAHTLLDLPLPAMIANVNRTLVKRGTGNRFVTFFFGILDPGGSCHYVNAGHNPPLLVKRDGSLTELTEGGMVLGLFAAAEYRSGSIDFESGDHLVLFTDGVVEARNATEEEFGEERLHNLIRKNASGSAEQILSSLQETLAAFSANAPQHDDITAMVIGYRERDKR